MRSLRSEVESHLPTDWRHPVARESARRDRETRLLIAGAVALGVGLLAWRYLGPDLKRYLKIHSM